MDIKILSKDTQAGVTGGAAPEAAPTKGGYIACFVQPETGWQSAWVGPYADRETALRELDAQVSKPLGRCEIKVQYVPIG